jgi:hypothetical protein
MVGDSGDSNTRYQHHCRIRFHVSQPREATLVFYSSITIAFLFFCRPRIRWKWQTLRRLLIFAIVFGAAIGCGSINNPVIKPTGSGAANSGTTAGNYIIAVTGTSGSITTTTAVSVTVK